MRSRTVRRKTDRTLIFALASAAVAAFAGQFAFGTQPGFFLPVGICAVPFAASPQRMLAYRLAAAAALAGFIALIGLRQGSFFVPSLAALLFSVYTARPRRGDRAQRRH